MAVEPGIDIIGNNPDAMPAAMLQHQVLLLGRHGPAGGIIGRVNHHRFSARCQRCNQLFNVKRPMTALGRDCHARNICAGRLESTDDIGPARLYCYNPVARRYKKLSRQHQALHSRWGHCDLNRLQTAAQKFIAISTNRLPQRHRAIVRLVHMIAGLERSNCSVHN